MKKVEVLQSLEESSNALVALAILIKEEKQSNAAIIGLCHIVLEEITKVMKEFKVNK